MTSDPPLHVALASGPSTIVDPLCHSPLSARGSRATSIITTTSAHASVQLPEIYLQ